MVKIFACGVNEYRGCSNLSFCVNDATVFCKTFAENFMVDEIEVIAEKGNVTNWEYCKALRKFCERATEDDVLIVFHSGHGSVDELNDSYFIMSNTLNEDTRVYADTVIAYLNESKAKTKLMILDCCSSDVGEKYIPSIKLDTVVEKFYAEGITIFSSCKKTEESKSETGEISLFTQFLCNALSDKHLIRDGVLYFNDFQNLVSIYAANYNRKHPDETQTPVMRTSMIGTSTFPAKNYLEKTFTKPQYYYQCSSFDLLNMSADGKTGKGNEIRKFVKVRVVLKDMLENEDIIAVISQVVKVIQALDVPINSWKKQLLLGHPVEIINMTIHADYIDYEADIYKCHARWTLYDEDTKWHRGEMLQDECGGFYSYQFNTMYKYLKETRIKNTFTDEELVQFWKKQVDIVIKRTSEFDSIYHSYKNGDILVKELCRQALQIYSYLNEIYDQCDNACFPTPFSEYKEFSERSMKLINDARSLVFICLDYARYNGEEHLKNCVELELVNYYSSLKKWNDIQPW